MTAAVGVVHIPINVPEIFLLPVTKMPGCRNDFVTVEDKNMRNTRPVTARDSTGKMI